MKQVFLSIITLPILFTCTLIAADASNQYGTEEYWIKEKKAERCYKSENRNTENCQIMHRYIKCLAESGRKNHVFVADDMVIESPADLAYIVRNQREKRIRIGQIADDMVKFYEATQIPEGTELTPESIQEIKTGAREWVESLKARK